MIITKARIRELAEQAILRMRHSSRHLDWVELGIRVGMAEMRERAATEAGRTRSTNRTDFEMAVRDIRIEGESE